jgi:hypothetical protein
MPKVHRVTDERLCGAVTVGTGLNTNVFVNGLLASVVGDLNSHNMLGALISMSPGTIKIGPSLIPLVVSLMDQSSPDQIGLITHVTGLPTPGGGSPNVSAYGPLGSFGGGLGVFQALGGGAFGIPGVGEIMKIGTQVMGQVYRVANQGGGSGVVVMNNMTSQSGIGSGSTLTSANTGYTFTLSNYYSS